VSTLAQQLANGATIGSFYALIALGYTLVYGIVRLINFPHGDLAAVGSFVGLSVVSAAIAAGLPVVVVVLAAFGAAMVVTSLLMVAVLIVVYRPMLKRGAMLGLMIVALGVSMAIENSLQLIFGAAPQAFPSLLPNDGLDFGGVRISYTQMCLFGASILLMLGLWWLVQFTKLGLAMRALAVDHEAARLMGINVGRIVALAFAVGAALAAASGVMIGLYYTQVTFLMGFSLGLKAFTAAVIGGIGNVPGAMLGGFVIGMLEAICAGYVSGRWEDVFVFGVLILTLVIKPTGLLGERVAERM
jgi:branched-chain amino acid transport system permease protein